MTDGSRSVIGEKLAQEVIFGKKRKLTPMLRVLRAA